MDIRRIISALVGFLVGAVLTFVLVNVFGGWLDATVYHSPIEHAPMLAAFDASLLLSPLGGLLVAWLVSRKTNKDV